MHTANTREEQGEERNRETRAGGGELHQHAGGSHPDLTTNQGVSISDNQNSLRAHPRGPTLLEDFALREKITHFDHERIPERIVHARGTAAHGYFELFQPLNRYTTARVLSEIGVRVPVFARFSTVAGGAGSIDTPRDVRGFAVKFYTREGNWDLVGNDMPIFFIQDAMKFPDLVHAVKPEPDRGFPQAASAHETFWDFVSLSPETLHNVIWMMSDRGIPRSLRMIEGFGIHSFRLVNAEGESTFVRFHWRPRLGVQSTLWDEAVKIAGADQDFHRRDLFEAIQNGDFPAWDLAVQLFTEKEAEKFPFDHLDATKLIPEEMVPLQTIGRMTLDRWPDNFFADTEQVAFCPANIVPGIDFSNDPLLQGRVFSYLDTQLIRLGGPNFHQIPINAPQCPYANQQRDGYMQMNAQKGRVSHDPSSLQEDSPRENPAAGFTSASASEKGERGRLRAESFADHYSQPRLFWRSQTEPDQEHVVAAFVFELSQCETAHVRTRVVAHLRHVDETLARRVADGLGLAELPEAPPMQAPPVDMQPSPAFQTIGKMQATLEGRTLGILVTDGSDEAAIDALRRAAATAGARVKLVAPRLGVRLHEDKRVTVDAQLAGTPSVMFDAVALVLPSKAATLLSENSAALNFARDAFAHLKAIAVDAGGRVLLEAAGIPPDNGVFEAGNTEGFISAAKTRQWAREASVPPSA